MRCGKTRYRRHQYGAGRDGQALDARIDYGVGLRQGKQGKLVTPFGVYGQSPFGRRLEIGAQFAGLGDGLRPPLRFEVSGERYTTSGGWTDHRVHLSGLITLGG